MSGALLDEDNLSNTMISEGTSAILASNTTL